MRAVHVESEDVVRMGMRWRRGWSNDAITPALEVARANSGRQPPPASVSNHLHLTVVELTLSTISSSWLLVNGMLSIRVE